MDQKRTPQERVLKPTFGREAIYGLPEFLDGLTEAFDEPGDFTVEHIDEQIILTTKDGTQIHAFAREIFYTNPES